MNNLLLKFAVAIFAVAWITTVAGSSLKAQPNNRSNQSEDITVRTTLVTITETDSLLPDLTSGQGQESNAITPTIAVTEENQGGLAKYGNAARLNQNQRSG